MEGFKGKTKEWEVSGWCHSRQIKLCQRQTQIPQNRSASQRQTILLSALAALGVGTAQIVVKNCKLFLVSEQQKGLCLYVVTVCCLWSPVRLA